MAKFAVAFQEEVRRLARKEVKSLAGPASRAVAQHRREIAQLKRQLRALEKKLSALTTQAPAAASAESPEMENGGARFSARSVRAQRRKTGLSAADYGRLAGVSPLTIYNWESGKSRPRKAQLAALVALRGLGKREALAKLKQHINPKRRRGKAVRARAQR
jgi:DNA-binding transcriptional regulator YiaG